MNKKTTYDSVGLVYGNMWGGGEGSYPAQRLHAETRKDLVKQAKDGLDGSLDGGMGFERLIGALLLITKTTWITVNEKPFKNTESLSPVFIGKLSKKQKEHLFEYVDCM